MTDRRMAQIVAALNRERAYKIIRPGAGWGKAEWLEEAVQGKLCAPVKSGDILADAYKRNLLTPEEREAVEAQARTVQAARALGSVRSPAKAAAARENGKRGGRPRTSPARE